MWFVKILVQEEPDRGIVPIDDDGDDGPSVEVQGGNQHWRKSLPIPSLNQGLHKEMEMMFT